MIDFKNIKNHIIEMNEFQLKWRFTEEEYNQLPEEHLNQLKPLDKKASNFLDGFVSDFGLYDSMPFKKDFFKMFKTIDEIYFEENTEEKVKKWLYRRGFSFEKEVFLLWEEDLGMIVPWKIFIKYFDDFFYPGPDDLFVFDQSLNWAILFFHAGDIFFGTNEKYEIKQNI